MVFGPWQTVRKRHHRFCTDGTWDRVLTQVLTDADAAGDLDWAVSVSVDSTVVRAHQHGTNTTGPTSGVSSHTGRDTRGAGRRTRSRGSRRGAARAEPADHGVGRSRGGLSTKAHALVDGAGRPLVLICTPGQAGDSPTLPLLLGELRVPRPGPGRPRSTPTPQHPHRPARRQGLLRPSPPEVAARAGHHHRHPRTRRPDRSPETTRLHRSAPGHLRRQDRHGTQRPRAGLRPHQAVPRPADPLRRPRPDLPRCPRPAQHHPLVQRTRRHARAPSTFHLGLRPRRVGLQHERRLRATPGLGGDLSPGRYGP